LKSKEWLRRKLPLLLVLFCIFAIVVVIRSFKLPETEKQPVAGLILIGERADRGWNESHYDGLSSACKAYGCALRVREHVPEDEESLNHAVEELIDEGASAIYLTSFAEKLAPLCPPKQRAEEKAPIDEEMLREAYDTLKEFVASFDYDNAMFVLESLEDYRLPEDEEKRYQSIRSAIEKLDWEKARQILADA